MTVWNILCGPYRSDLLANSSCSTRRLDPDVDMLNWGYIGSMTRALIPSFRISSRASSVKGYQYLIPMYAFASTPCLSLSESTMRSACALVYCNIGDPPPMDSYASRLLGALRFDITSATRDCRGARRGGRRMMSGSAKRL